MITIFGIGLEGGNEINLGAIPTFEGLDSGKDKLIDKLTFNMYYDRFKNISLTTFKWKNLPNDINSDYIERILFETGKIAFVNDENFGLQVRQYSPIGINYQNRAVKICLTGNENLSELQFRDNYPLLKQYYVNTYNYNPEFVEVFNTPTKTPMNWISYLYAYRLTSCERTLDTNRISQRHPVVILTNKKKQLSDQNIWKEYENNPVIFLDQDIELGNYKTLDLTTGNYAPQMIDEFNFHYNNALRAFGINIGSDKKERVTTGENSAHSEQTDFLLDTRLKERQESVELINKYWGYNIEVEVIKRDFKEFPDFSSFAATEAQAINELEGI